MNEKKPHFTENAVVRLKREYASTRSKAKAVIVGWLSDVKGGCVVSPELEGMRCWNIEHLEIVGDGTIKNNFR